MKLKSILILFLGLIALSFSACNNNENQSIKNEKLQVLSSFSIITNIIEEIGQDKVEIHSLVPLGTDPHDYEPRPNDIKFATQADIVFYNGLNLEGGNAGWLMKLVQSVGIAQEKIVEVSKEVEPMYLKDEKGMQEVNPHAFISPKVGIIMAKTIGEALAKIDAENENFYLENTNIYIEKLEAIDAHYQTKIAEIPEENRVFMASELAFQYLNAAYGLKEGFIWAIDTDDIGIPAQIKNAIEFVNTHQPPVLFVESNVDRRPMETISKATGVPIFEKAIFSDELGKPGQEAGTYLKFLEYNLDVIYSGLK